MGPVLHYLPNITNLTFLPIPNTCGASRVFLCYVCLFHFQLYPLTFLHSIIPFLVVFSPLKKNFKVKVETKTVFNHFKCKIQIRLYYLPLTKIFGAKWSGVKKKSNSSFKFEIWNLLFKTDGDKKLQLRFCFFESIFLAVQSRVVKNLLGNYSKVEMRKTEKLILAIETSVNIFPNQKSRKE